MQNKGESQALQISRRQIGKGIAGSLAFGAVQGAGALTQGAGAHAAQRSGRSSGVTELAWTAVHDSIWRTTVGSSEEHSPVPSRLIPPAQTALANLPHVEAPPLQGVRAFVDARGTHVTLPLAAGELMYGFGLQLQSFQQRGKKRTNRVNADPKGDSGDSHAPVPFYVTTRGYGVLIDTFRQAAFHCGGAHPKPTKPAGRGAAAVNTPGQMRENDRHESSEVRVEVPRATGVDVYLFGGPTMLQAVQRYNMFAGGGVQPPEWALGFWYRPEMHLDDKAVLALAAEFRSRDLPCDVLGLEPGWQTHAYSCSFAWEPSRFPDPKRFISAAGAQGYRINLWEHAFTHPTSPIFEPLVPHAGDYAVWQGLVPDFAGKPAREIFGEYHAKALIDAGVSGFKLDECDGSDFTEGWSWPDFARFPSGLDGEQMHAAFGLRYQHAVLDAFRGRKQETFGLVRSSGALATPYPFALYSDLYNHREFIRGVINAGFSGLLWCPEVRDAENEEDLVRRLQSAVFSPLAMVNAWYIRNPPWKQIKRELNNDDQFAPGWEALEARCREIIGWRMSLVPYLRSAFALYAAEGKPAFRSPVLDFPEDSSLHTVDDQFMVGDRLLVAPLFAGEAQRSVTLPAGDWHDFWTGQAIQGGRRLQVDRRYAKIPVYVRSGALVPWAEIGQSSQDPKARHLRVRVYGDGQMSWQGCGADLDGVTLRWNAATQQGENTAARGSARPYTITGWDRIA